MKAEVISSGTELMQGRGADGNFVYLARRLGELGHDVRYHSTYGDDRRDLDGGLKLALARADLVVMTGGLGPTSDDLTRDVASEVFHRPLEFRPALWRQIVARFRRFGRVARAIQRVQARMPRGARALRNDQGSAPGFVLREGRQVFVALPGPPNEMQPMFEKFVAPTLGSRRPPLPTFRLFGLMESEVEEKVRPYFAKLGIPYGITVKRGAVTVVPRRGRHATWMRRTFGDRLFTEDERDLEAVVGERLIELRKTVAIAESCTGGLVADRLTDVPGISDVLLEAVVAYSDESKTDRLGVWSATLRRCGAVSSEVACEMAAGAARRAGADYGLSTTGIAGPSGGSKEKPVGLVWIGLFHRGRARAFKKLYPNRPRRMIKERAADAALNVLRLGL